MRQRLDETLNEARRHFSNYVKIRNQFNKFLENKLLSSGYRSQKVHNEVLNSLIRNLEAQEQMLIEEREALEKGFKNIECNLERKRPNGSAETAGESDKGDKQVRELQEEIERRQFLEQKV